MKRLSAVLLPALLAAFLPASARAQDVEREGRKPARDAKASRQAQEEAKEAGKLEAEGPAVTYAQVLADPDNVDLNYRWARQQVRRGDLKGASATLERVLLVSPKLVRVRFFYAVVLYRLDDLVGAKRQFETLQKLDLGAEGKAEVEGYLKAIERRQRRTQLSGRLAMGFEYVSNRNAAPSSNQRLFGDTPLVLSGDANRREDTSWVFMAGVDARRKTGASRKHELFAALDYYRAEQSEIETLNLSAVSASAGGTYHTRWADLTPSAHLDHVALAHQTFLRNRGGALRVNRRLSRRAALRGELRATYQDYARTAEIPVAPERTGELWEASLGADWMLSPKMRLGTGLGGARKTARRDYNAYERKSLDLTHTWLLGRGTFLLSSFIVNYDTYDDPDPFISRFFRKDTTFRVSSTYGAPLSLVHKSLKDFMWTFTYEFYKALSNIDNYAYTNNRAATMLTYRWELGL